MNTLVSNSQYLHDTIPIIVASTIVNRKAKKVAYVHGMPYSKDRGFLSRLYYVLSMKSLSRFDLIYAINRSIVKYLEEHLRLKNKVLLTTNGAPSRYVIERVDLAEWLKREYDVGFLGSISPLKGGKDLLLILGLLIKIRPKTKALIIGAAPPWFTSYLKKLGIERQVKVIGPIYNDETKFDLLRKVRVFVFPSHEETWGIAIVEALASGCIVIAYDLPVYKEIFRDSLITVPRYDYKGIAKKVLDILFALDNHEYSRLEKYLDRTRRGRDLVERYYTWDKVAKHEIEALKGKVYSS
jgi:glycosyltransferase involved in cell wall biosynthesis